ncbi:hypothetical protein C8A03DRAFT_33070 [Achaetomium macrosporum]|uniref:Uncharacterized protein n=1 Tax=Achaetomium macrosporum TaxID=79813 RepID=A0AAN7CCR8_9PEZI|nr:hypothetical protein C8A03DRAFT_33070 [Achaetomium macrosporum]
MGGIVVKKAYTLGKHDKRFAYLISSVTGIVFLATPHRGSHYAKTLNNVLAAIPTAGPPRTYVTLLERHSAYIEDINGVFSDQCEDSDLILVSFYEAFATKLGFKKPLIVDKNSAILGHPKEIIAPMRADHNTICKFENDFDSNFLKLKEILKKLLPTSRPRDLGKISPENVREIQAILGIFDDANDDLYTHRLNSEMWDDCLATVSVTEGGYASRVLATANYFITSQRRTGTVKVWNAETCTQLRVINTGGPVRLITLNKAGMAVATVSTDNCSVWELLTGKRIYSWAKPTNAMILDVRFGRAVYELIVALHNDTVSRIDLRSGATVEYPIPPVVDPDFSYYGPPWRVALSPDLTNSQRLGVDGLP